MNDYEAAVRDVVAMLGEEPFVTVHPHLHIRDFFGRSANGFALTVEIRLDVNFNLGFVRERSNEIVIGSQPDSSSSSDGAPPMRNSSILSSPLRDTFEKRIAITPYLPFLRCCSNIRGYP